ncbi:AraC family transcriptional regulator ligand-binding domain-containing protein [Streptomyces sp. NPDC006879]|uniref:AraC family transcriptional regulator ligand-binding domain-containing protein n=1 Tax=Streptomyces sp. NPDC006879 TaxID=3364767 RepID=UPI0036B4CEBB
MAAPDFTVYPAVQALLNDLGVEPARVLRRAGLPGDLFTGQSVTLSPAQYFALWRGIEAESGDPELPITIGRALSAEVFDPPLFAALCSPDLNTAARRIATYKRLIEPMRVSVTVTPAQTMLACEWPPDMHPPALLALAELVFWVTLARIATRVHVEPLRVTVPDPPVDNGGYRDFLGVRVSEGPGARSLLRPLTPSGRSSRRTSGCGSSSNQS